MSSFTWTVRVYIEDTDFGGVVFYGNYLKYLERARTEWLRSLGISNQSLLIEQELVFVVKAISVQYQAPARLDDVLTLRLNIQKYGKASVQFRQEVWRDGQLLVSADVHIVSVDVQTWRPKIIPTAILEKMQSAFHVEGTTSYPDETVRPTEILKQ